MGTNSTGCTEWERDFDSKTEQPMEYVDLSSEVISVDRVGGYWRVLWNGKIAKTFTCEDAEHLAHGYALAMLDGRELR